MPGVRRDLKLGKQAASRISAFREYAIVREPSMEHSRARDPRCFASQAPPGDGSAAVLPSGGGPQSPGGRALHYDCAVRRSERVPWPCFRGSIARLGCGGNGNAPDRLGAGQTSRLRRKIGYRKSSIRTMSRVVRPIDTASEFPSGDITQAETSLPGSSNAVSCSEAPSSTATTLQTFSTPSTLRS